MNIKSFPIHLALTLTYYILNIQAQLFAQCTTPSTGAVFNITPTTASPSYGCCQQGTYYLEYGLTGFIPGTAGSPGTGGTLVTVPSNPASYTITGLTPATTYDTYMRIFCTAGSWTANSPKRSFSTAPDCNSVPIINCNTMTTLNVPAGPGAWSLSSASCFNVSTGREAIYRFTPTVSGNHILLVHPAINGNQNPFSYYYKAASSGCNGSGWTCIGFGWPNQNSQLSFGPLTAGTQYLILADVYNDFMTSTADQFRIECPYCPQPANIVETNKTPVSIGLSWTGSASVLEYGPNGFIPGTGFTAGNSGTVVFVSGTSWTISGLSPQTSYDIYLRSGCGGGNYSPNSLEFGTFTASCPASYPYPALGTYVYLYSSGTGYWNGYPTCFGSGMYGQESIFNFTAPSSGYFEVRVSYGWNFYGFMYRPSSTVCDLAGYTCPFPTYINSSTDLYTIGPLTAGAVYDLFFDVSDTTGGFPQTSFVINCPNASSVAESNISPNSITFSWNCNCPASAYLEYGPDGFTPGTGSSAGTNGTLIPGVSSPYTLAGLTANTKYDVYLRTNCGGNFSTNTAVLKVKTAVDCSTAPVINCSDYLTFCVSGFSNSDNGAWQSTACGGGNLLSAESVWRFTPAQTGPYSILVYAISANSIYYNYPATFYIKQASFGCNEMNWNCVGNVSGSVSVGLTPVSLSLGTLTAGTTYYLMADGVQPTFTGGYCYYFRMDCPNVCSWPKLSSVNDVTMTSAKILAICDSCMGPMLVEYGLAGFTPGTGSAPGPGGTLISGTYFPVTISGLTNGATYNVYARKNCGANGGFSINSNMLSFTPCATAPSGITTNTGNNFVCAGDSITLSKVGGALPAGGSYKWYASFCGSTMIGSGNSIKVAPVSTTSYFVRGEASCGVSNCASVSITVYANPTAVISVSGATTFCSGDSVVLTANSGTGLSYQWKKDGSNISGANIISYVAKSAGNYKVTVTNSSGCSAISSAVAVSVKSLPSTTITASGPLSFCSGGSVTLQATVAANRSYQWKRNGSNISGATASSYVATASGNYKVTVTNTNSGCLKTTSNGTLVTAFPNPPATITPNGPTTFCAGGSVTLTANPGTGFTYNWKKNNASIPGATGISYIATTAGNYKVKVTDANGCTKLSDKVIVTVPCREGEAVAENDFTDAGFQTSVYPNPSSGDFNFEFNNPAGEKISVRIYDVIGKKIFAIETFDSQFTIHHAQLNSGIYAAEILSGENRKVIKMMKTK